MIDKAAYTTLQAKRRMLGVSFRQILLIYLIINATVCMTYARTYQGEYDEILIYISVPGIGAGETNAVIRGEELFLPVTDLFDFLRIRNVPDPGLDLITGFFIDQKAEYIIDRLKNTIVFNLKNFELDPGSLIRTETNLYLRSDYFGKIFGLNCIFNFRDLSVIIETDLQLPAIRELKIQEMRKNLNRLKGDVIADTIVPRSYPFIHFGMADWSVIATEQVNGRSEARMNLNLGSIIAGGETTVNLNYNTAMPFTEKQQMYRWRYVNNENSALRQVIAGKILTNATSSIYNPVVGVQLTNTPSSFRRSFGSYTLTDRTEPGWVVELYVNNVLVDYVKADASGFYTFEVPLVYGNTNVKLKFFGPWGEESTKEQSISVPFNFLPEKTFEYTVSAGVVEDTLLSRFSRTSFNYGVNRGLTIGAGMEYLSSVTSAPFMPYVNGSLKLAPGVLISGEYTHNVRSKGRFSVRLPSNFQFDIDYTKYAPDQKAVNFNYLEERKVSLAIPFRSKRVMIYNRFSVDQLVLPSINYTAGEWMISGSAYGVNTNISTMGIFMGERSAYVYSNFSLALRLPKLFTLIPQAQYSYTDKYFLSAKILLEKQIINKAFFNLSFEKNFKSNISLAEIGFRYDFKFAQAGASARRSATTTTFIQYARGSIINNRQTRYLGTDNRMNVGRGGISILPFLDINADGKWNNSEPRVSEFSLHSSSGRMERSEKDSLIRILNLEPYTDCFVEFDKAGLENISWMLRNTTMKIAVDPNMLKVIEVPILVAGEASGMISFERRGQSSGLGRMKVNFYSQDQNLVSSVLSEEDGYFSYMGLTPGIYDVRLDTTQLRKLGMTADTNSIRFNVGANIEGDYIEGLDFTVRVPFEELEQPEFIAAKDSTDPGTKVIKETTRFIIHEGVRELITITEDSYAIQLGAFQRMDYADEYRRRIQTLLNKKVEIVFEDGFYKLRVMDLKNREEVDRNVTALKDSGIDQVWILTLKAMSRHMLVTETVDSLMRVKAESGKRIPETPVIAGTMADTAINRFYTDMSIQVGAFRNEEYAKAFREKISLTLDKDIEIVKEDGWHKVRISGFESDEDLERYLPALGLHGIRDMWIVSVKQKPAAGPVLQAGADTPKPVISVKPDSFPIAEKTLDAPVTMQPDKTDLLPVKDKRDTTNIPLEDQPIAPAAPPEPTISLQVALFNKRNQAERAQKRITTKLALPVEIVEQWGYYKVIVTGFYTREETFQYYPELAGLGYPNIILIEPK